MKVTQKKINDILNQKIKSPESLLLEAVCNKCGAIKVLDKYCTYCAAKRRQQYLQRKEQDRLGVPRKNDIDYAYERLFEQRKLSPKDMENLKHETLLAVLHELEGVLELSIDEQVQVSVQNQERAAHILKVL